MMTELRSHSCYRNTDEKL